MNKELDNDYGADLAILFFVVGSILLYLGGLYGNFDVVKMLIISGILMKLYSVFLIWSFMIRNSKVGRRKLVTKKWN